MTYSSGIFYEETNNLSEAQENKYQSILDMLNLKEGARILEIGCGWGGFAEYIGKNHDVNLDCITIYKKHMNLTKNAFMMLVLIEKINIEIERL